MSGTVDQTGLRGLRRRLNGSVLLPGQDGYEEARAVFNAMIDTRPALIAPSTDVEDVSARAQADRVALSSASRAALSGSIGRNVSIARFAAVTSSGARAWR